MSFSTYQSLACVPNDNKFFESNNERTINGGPKFWPTPWRSLG